MGEERSLRRGSGQKAAEWECQGVRCEVTAWFNDRDHVIEGNLTQLFGGQQQ